MKKKDLEGFKSTNIQYIRQLFPNKVKERSFKPEAWGPAQSKGLAWKTGFDIFGMFYPHSVLTILSLLFFAIALCRFYDYFLINPSIPQMLSFYGVIHVVASALGFLSQGSIGWELAQTGIGYLIFGVVFLRRN